MTNPMQAAPAVPSVQATGGATPALSIAQEEASTGTINSLPSNMNALRDQQPQLYNLLIQSNFISFTQQNNAIQQHIHDMNQESNAENS